MRTIRFILTFLFPLITFAQTDTTQKIIEGRRNSKSQQQKPYVILISADGFRYDLADKYNAVTLKKLRSNGVEATAMRPSYPSLTFPNHYTIVTGLYPSHHGLIDNTFYDKQKDSTYKMSDRKKVVDSSYYGGIPLWVLAEKQQMLTASFYWVGSEAAIQGIRPTYYYLYNDKIGIDDRIQVLKNWLTLPEEKRPHLITFYFPQVDHEEHTHGPDSKEAAEAVHFIDESIQKMVHMTDSLKLPVNYIFVSDHGMTAVDTLNTLQLPSAIDTSKFIIPDSDLLLHLYAKNKRDVNPTYKALKKQASYFDAYLAENIPARWHYSKKDDRYNRIGDILIVPKYPKVFSLKKKKISPGKHGYDNFMPDMQASFFAWGPALKRHIKINTFSNVHVYPMIAKILGLPFNNKIDGSFIVLKNILR